MAEARENSAVLPVDELESGLPVRFTHPHSPVEVLIRVGGGIRTARRPPARTQVLQNLSEGSPDQQIRLGPAAPENVLQVVSGNPAEPGMSDDATHRAGIPPVRTEG